MESLLITGGQGFLGSYIVRSLLRNPKRIPFHVLDHEPFDGILRQVLTPEELKQVSLSFGDISDFNVVYNAVKASKPSHIIHLAALQIPSCRVDPLRGAQVNVTGTLNIFEAARRFSQEHQQIIPSITYASSAAVAGHATDYTSPLTDNTPHTPRTHYGVFKLANEGNAKVFWFDHNIASVALRPHTIYGVGREVGVTSGPTKAIKAALLGRPYQIQFQGKTCFLFVEDAAELFLQCAERTAEGALALNMRGNVVDLSEFLDVLNRELPQAKDLISVAPNAPTLPLAYDFQDEGLGKLLGAPVRYTPLDEGVAKTIRTFQNLREQNLLHDRDLD